MSTTTPRFEKDYASFSKIERDKVKKLKKLIISSPTPPDNDDWKYLKQFKELYPEGDVCAMYINHHDRLVYELNSETGDITFTNCRGHKYRGKSYSEMESRLSKLFSEIKPTCTTKSQKLAFNRLLNTFKFDTSK